MASYNSSNSSTLIPASNDKFRLASEVVDFSTTTNVANDNFDVIGIPANSYVVTAGCDVLTVDSAGNTGKIAVGDSSGAAIYVAAVAPTSATQLTPANTTGKCYASANDIRLTITDGAINAKVRVWAIMISLDKGGTEKDTESQSVTFA